MINTFNRFINTLFFLFKKGLLFSYKYVIEQMYYEYFTEIYILEKKENKYIIKSEKDMDKGGRLSISLKDLSRESIVSAREELGNYCMLLGGTAPTLVILLPTIEVINSMSYNTIKNMFFGDWWNGMSINWKEEPVVYYSIILPSKGILS